MSNRIWVGEERRASQCPCEKAEELERRVEACREQVDRELAIVHASVGELSSEVHALRNDVHRMTESVGSMQTSLETIASTLTKLTDFPETWAKVQGFWAVMRWLKDNLIPIVVILAVFGYAAKKVLE